ncbi:MAG: D-alanyl-D-alanine carboxypeptidase/D-alanyl-D-alanine-endopeptidase [Bacteroidales bacterium]|nr:D-alanyl-D-alanine carboxypeptidase/D-alanyl-D-alanine-endopeptidase [Bacteroidales bacterium]
MKKTYIIIISLMLAGIYGGSAQSTLAGKAAQLQAAVEGITADPALSEAVMSICARSGDGRTLVDIDGDNMVMPASNMKLISTGAALHALGSDYRFKTGLGHDGKIVDGVLKGNLYIIGGGDPTLGSKDSIATSLDRTFAQWEKFVRDAGIRRIEGMIIGDGRYFEGMPEHPSWLWSDIGTYYGAGATGLMFYENMQSFTASPGQKVGAPVNIAPSYPETPWMEFRYNCATGDKGTGDQLYMYASDLAPVAEIRGTFGIDRARKRVDCSNKFPEYTCASYFADYLKGRGIPSEGPADFRLCTDISGTPAANLTMLGSTSSPSLKRIAFETNHASNNLYAETLFRSIGKAKTGSACYDSSYVSLNDVLKELEIKVSKGLQIVDGSGLSRQNYVSADFICGFLAAMMESPCFEDYVYSLPSPGSHGTLAYNMQNIPAETKARIKVKSGSMNGVRCYSGYIIPTEGCKEDTIIFSIMVNNCTAPTWKIRPLLDKIMTALAEAN